VKSAAVDLLRIRIEADVGLDPMAYWLASQLKVESDVGFGTRE
jgi:hypothetical protein